MGGGGKGGGGGGAQVPEFVKRSQKRVSEVGRQVFDISKPGLQLGSNQALSLISTGGPGARVPMLNQAVRAQQRGTQQAQSAVGEALNRAGTSTSFQERILGQIGRQGEMAARNIPIRAAVPLITGATGTALGGSAMGSRGAAAGLQALGAGLRQQRPSGKPGGGDALSGLLGLFGKEGAFPGAIGGIKGLFGGGASGGFSGYTATTDFI